MKTAKRFTHEGRALTLRQWAVEANIPYYCLRTRMRNWKDLDRALSQTHELHRNGAGCQRIDSYGIKPCFTEWITSPIEITD